MTQEEAVNVFDLVVKNKDLPATLDKLVPLSFIGSAAVKFYQAKVKLMDQLGVTETQRKATLGDGQDAGEMLLNIEARIGELYESAPEAERPGRPALRPGPTKHDIAPKASAARKRMQGAEAIHRNPAAVKAIIKEARENEDIPTKTAVLNKIALDKEKARREAAETRQKPSLIVSLEQQGYLTTLERIISLLPVKPPKDWTEQAFKQAQGLVKIILRRLEGFTNGEQGKAEKRITG